MLRMHVSVVMLLLFQSGSAVPERTTTFSNGCVLVQATDSDTMSDPHLISRPFLNCSGLRKTFLDLSGTPQDIVSLSLSYNELRTFHADDLIAFTDLENLDLGHNKISTLFPALKMHEIYSWPFHRLILSHNKLTQVPTEFLKSFSDIYHLDISGNEITAIRDDDFKHTPELSYLIAGSNPLKSISSIAFTNFTETLRSVALPFSGLKKIPQFVSNMSSLVYLSLTNNEISSVPRRAFYRAKSLQWLELASNKIRRIDRLAFTGIEKLHLLDLTDNLLESMPSNVLDSVMDEERFSIEMYENPLRCDCSLRWLKIWTDKMQHQDIRYKCSQPNRNHGKKSYELKQSDFSCEPNDKEWKERCSQEAKKPSPVAAAQAITPPKEIALCPSRCICYVSKGKYNIPLYTISFRSLPGSGKYVGVECSNAEYKGIPDDIREDVNYITLKGNLIETLNVKDLKLFQQLKTLTLARSKLKTLKSDVTATMFNLTALYLPWNELTVFSSDHLKSFPNLETLSLENNEIQDLQENMFQYNRKLRALYLSGNALRTIHLDFLNGLASLHTLSLRNTNLREIPRIRLQDLTQFDLSDNCITIIPNDSFASIANLESLHLAGNRITTITSGAFSNSSALRSIDLSRNRIDRFPRGVFDNLNNDGFRVALLRNKMYCDCRMRWFKEWIEMSEITTPGIDVRFICSRPLRLHGEYSESLSAEDFSCKPGDWKAKPNENERQVEDEYYFYVHGTCHNDSQLTAAIFLTMIFTILSGIFIRWCCSRKNSGYARYKPQEDVLHLNMDT